MKIYSKIVIDIRTGRIIDAVKIADYDGPISILKGGGSTYIPPSPPAAALVQPLPPPPPPEPEPTTTEKEKKKAEDEAAEKIKTRKKGRTGTILTGLLGPAITTKPALSAKKTKLGE